MSTLTPEENEAIRKAAEDKAYAENPESKRIQEQREALAKEEAERIKKLEEKEQEKPYDPNSIRAERYTIEVGLPVLAGGAYQYVNGEIIAEGRPIQGTSKSLGERLSNLGYSLPMTVADLTVFLSDSAEAALIIRDTNSNDNTTVSISELIERIKKQGPFNIEEKNNSFSGPSSTVDDQFMFDPMLILGDLSAWKDALETINQEYQVLTENRNALKDELTQLTELRDTTAAQIANKENEIVLEEGIRQEYEDLSAELELAVQEALNLRDSYPEGSPEWIAADAALILAVEALNNNINAIEGANNNILALEAEILELNLKLDYLDARIPTVQDLIQVTALEELNLNNGRAVLAQSIREAENFKDEVYKKYPTLDEDFKTYNKEVDTLLAREQGIKDDLQVLAKRESEIRSDIHKKQFEEAATVAQNIIGDGSINKKGELVAPTGAFAAAAARAQEVVNQLNKPVYTEKELVEIKRQNDEAKQIENFRASRTDKGKMGFSGCDITAVLRVPQYARGKTTFNENLIFQLGTLQTIAISTYNAKTPVKSIGFKNPIAIARGGRTIAGTMIFNQLHRHVFDDNAYGEVINDKNGFMTYSQGDTQYFIDSKEIRAKNEDPYASAIKDAEDKKAQKKSATVTQAEVKNKIERFKPGTNKESYSPKQYDYVSFDPKKFKEIEGPWQPADEAYLADLKERQKAWQNNLTKGYLSDEDIKNKSYINKKKLKKQWDFSWDTSLVGERIKPSDLPPFDIIIMLVNEMGNVGKIILYGVEIIHDSQTLSVEDIYTEAQYQYIAKDIEYFHANDFEETKAWVSSLPIYGYKGFYLANIERAQKELNDFKSKMAQQAYDLASNIKAAASGITDGAATARLIKQISLNRLKAELADLEKQLQDLQNSVPDDFIKSLQKLLFETQDLLAAKKVELENALQSTSSDYSFWKTQNVNFKERVYALYDAKLNQTELGVVVAPQVQKNLANKMIEWDLYFESMNEFFFNDLDSIYPNDTFYPDFGDRSNKAKLVYEYFFGQRSKSQSDLNSALSKFKLGEGALKGYVVFWDEAVARELQFGNPLYPQRGIDAKKKLEDYAARFASYYNDRIQFEAALAGARTSDITARGIFAKWPVQDKAGKDIDISQVVSNLKNIIQKELGPLEHPQYSYKFYIDEAKYQKEVERQAAEGVTLYPIDKAFEKDSSGQYVGSVDKVLSSSQSSSSVLRTINLNGLNSLIKAPIDRGYSAETSILGPNVKYPFYLQLVSPGTKDLTFLAIPLKYDYLINIKTTASDEFAKFTQEPYTGQPADSRGKSLSTMTVAEFLIFKREGEENVKVFLDNLKYDFINLKSSWKDNAYMKMTVIEFFTSMNNLAVSIAGLKGANPSADLGSYESVLKFKDDIFSIDYARYMELSQRVVLEVISNENIKNGPPESYSDLKKKVDFYTLVLKGALNENLDENKKIQVNELLNLINEKRRTIALVTSGTYDPVQEENRANLLQNTQAGPSSPIGQALPVPFSASSPSVPAATSVPQEPENTGPAPEQTNFVRPPRAL